MGQDGPMSDDRLLYRTVIDALVVQCRSGQGQVSARRVTAGVWNENAEAVADAAPDQHAMNVLLGALTPEQRTVLAGVLAEEFASGVYNALQILQAAQVPPFQQGYDGSVSDNFLDRLDDWAWPEA